jgi:hypothetical protein
LHGLLGFSIVASMFDTACELSGIPRNEDKRHQALAHWQFLDSVIPSMFGMLTSAITRSTLVAADLRHRRADANPWGPSTTPSARDSCASANVSLSARATVRSRADGNVSTWELIVAPSDMSSSSLLGRRFGVQDLIRMTVAERALAASRRHFRAVALTKR